MMRWNIKIRFRGLHLERKTENVAKSGKESRTINDQERRQIDTGYHISIVYGRRTMERSKNLHGLLDFSEVPKKFRNYIPDYQIHVLDVCHTPDERLLEFPKDIATMFFDDQISG